MKTFHIMLTSLFFIAGCTSTKIPNEIDVIEKPMQKIEIKMEKPSSLLLRDWGFSLIKDKNGKSYYVVDEENFKKLNGNFIEIERYLNDLDLYLKSKN